MSGEGWEIPFMTNAIEGGTVMRPILKHVSEIATQLSVAPSGSSARSLAAVMIPMVAGERMGWFKEGVFVPTAGVCKMGAGAELGGGLRGWLSLSLTGPFLFFEGLTKRWIM